MGWLIALVVACMSLFAPLAHAAGARIDAEVSLEGAQVHVTGVLSDAGGHPIGQATLTASLGGHNLAEGQSQNDGTFSIAFSAPDSLRGSQLLVVSFDGRGKYSAARASTTLNIDPAQPPATSSAPAAPTTSLTATADLPEPSNGSFVTISGKLVSPQGEPITNAGILLFSPTGEVEEGYAITNDAGAFTTHYEVPVDAEGDHQLTVRFDGADNFPGAETQVVLKVQHQDVASKSPTPTAEPSSEPQASESHSDDHTFDGAASASPIAEGQEAANQQGSRPGGVMMWFIGGLVIVGGLSALLAVVLLTNIRQRRPAVEHASGLDFFDDDPPDAPPPAAPRRAAH